jgi:DNA-binding NtrC family response regulator
MSSKAILCVDDEAIIVMSIKQELKAHFKERFIYETALNAREALTIIDELNADGVRLILIISDWLMPGMKGDEFAALVKEKHPGIQTILVTGHAPEETISGIKNRNIINAVIFKPWRNNDLISTVEHCIEAMPAGI